uniref:Uncharacterized protein n=1 Tax=Cannabis sativa TaxID=3483 RepID=A0A803PBA6_CANSA
MASSSNPSSRASKRLADAIQQRELRAKARQEPPLMFYNEEDYQRYVNNLSSRKILNSKICDLPSLDYVHDFSHHFEVLGVKGTLRGVTFDLNVDSLNPLLGAPNGIPTLHEKKVDPTSNNILGSKTFKDMGYAFTDNAWVFTPKRGKRMQIDLESDDEDQDEDINLPTSKTREEEEVHHQAPPMPHFSHYNIEEACSPSHLG